jgi:hypothetical protein
MHKKITKYNQNIAGKLITDAILQVKCRDNNILQVGKDYKLLRSLRFINWISGGQKKEC